MKYVVEDVDSACTPVSDTTTLIHIISSCCSRHASVKRAALFGSFARGEQTDSSDVDLLVQSNPAMGLRECGELGRDLVSSCGRDVDIITSLSDSQPYFIRNIVDDGVIAYENCSPRPSAP